jgi:hypothetical protein
MVFLSTQSILFIRLRSSEATNLFSIRSASVAPTMFVLHHHASQQ